MLLRLVSNHIAKGANFQVWVQVNFTQLHEGNKGENCSLKVPLVAPNPHKFEAGDETPLEDTWDWWNRF